MTDADRPRFSVAMNWLAKKYPLRKGQDVVPRKLSVDELRDMFEVLRDIHIERIEWAAKYHYGHCSFFPDPGELRKWSGLAPTPKQLPPPERRRIAEEMTPTAESRRRLQEIFDGCNRQFGTRLRAE